MTNLISSGGTNMVYKNTQVADDEYIHIETPKWYWYLILATIGVTIAIILITAAITQFQGSEWLTTAEGDLTVFEVGITIGFFGSLIGGILLIIAVYFFPQEIRPKSYPSYKKLPWAE